MKALIVKNLEGVSGRVKGEHKIGVDPGF